MFILCSGSKWHGTLQNNPQAPQTKGISVPPHNHAPASPLTGVRLVGLLAQAIQLAPLVTPLRLCAARGHQLLLELEERMEKRAR